MNNPIKHISIFLGLFILQTLVLNQINVNGFINPYVFPLFIILLPFDTKPWVLLLVGFSFGFFIDLFNGTMGMHAFATTLMAFLRPYFLNTFQPKSEKYNYPSLKNNGFAWLLVYVTSMLAIHHFCYFFIEAGSFSAFFLTLLLIIVSLIISTIISFLLLFTFNSSKK